MPISISDIENLKNLSIDEFLAWRDGAFKRMDLERKYNGNLIAAILNCVTGSHYCCNDIYPTMIRKTEDIEEILLTKLHLGGAEIEYDQRRIN